MKTNKFITSIFVSAALICSTAVVSSAQKYVKVEDFEALQSSIDSTNSALLTKVDEKISEIDLSIAELEDSIEKVRRSAMNHKSTYYDVSEDLKEWVLLIIFAIALPGVLVYLYIKNEKLKEKKYNTLVDLVRSGVDIKEELLPYLVGSRKDGTVISGGIANGMNEYDLSYCTKRLFWAAVIFLFAILMGILSNEEVVFVIFAFCACVPALQAVVRYFNVSYLRKHTSSNDKTSDKNNAE